MWNREKVKELERTIENIEKGFTTALRIRESEIRNLRELLSNKDTEIERLLNAKLKAEEDWDSALKDIQPVKVEKKPIFVKIDSELVKFSGTHWAFSGAILSIFDGEKVVFSTTKPAWIGFMETEETK